MAEIQQWRLKIPSARSRTPLPDAADLETDSRPATALGSAPVQPPTPKRGGLRPKLSQYLAHNGPFGSGVKLNEAEHLPEEFQTVFPSWPREDPYPDPQPERLMDSIMCRLLADPYDTLDPRFNTALLQIFEAFRNLVDERNKLRAQLTEEVECRSSDKGIMQYAESKWRDERQAYKAEVKRLELIISKGKRGVADVALARQDSILRNRKALVRQDNEPADDGKETVLEFLEKTKLHEDPAWSSQRATMKARAPSPSAKLARLSRKLTKKASSSSLQVALPLGSHHPDVPNTTAALQSSDVPMITRRAAKLSDPQRRLSLEQSPDASDGTSSTFSCAGDLLPDEMAEGVALSQQLKTSPLAEDPLSGLPDMTSTGSRRRGVSEQSFLPKTTHGSVGKADRDARAPPGEVDSSSQARTLTRKPSQLFGFINRLKPQLALEAANAGRRFSFEVGDDAASLPPNASFAVTSRESMLRKSVSLSSLSDMGRHLQQAEARTIQPPTQASPAKSATTTDSRRPSKIPSPSFHGVLAKPRGNGSRSSSIYSTQSTVSLDADRQRGKVDLSSQDAAAQHIADHTNVLRSGAAAAAARAVSNASLASSRAHGSRRASSQRKQWLMQHGSPDLFRSGQPHAGPFADSGTKENRPLSGDAHLRSDR